MSTVSIIIPTYNCAERLVQALGSVVHQTYKRDLVEVLVIDDGSTDHTREQTAEFIAGSDLDIRYVRQDNAGPAAARNHGMRMARGVAIAFLDDDDLWLPAKLERQLPLLRGDVGLVYCDNVFVDAAGSPLSGYVRKIELVRGDARLALFNSFFLLTSGVCLQRAMLDETGYFDERLAVGEDYDFFLRLVARCEIDFVPEKLLIRTVRPDSLSRRDYVLDCNTDIATLTGYLRAQPEFARQNRAAVHRRIADYRYEFAYRLLQDGRRMEAWRQLSRSLACRPSFRAAKACARLALPRRGRAAVARAEAGAP